MLKQNTSVALVVSSVHSMCLGTPLFASEKALKASRYAEEVRSRVLSLSDGEKAFVHVKLRDKTNLHGYISDMGPDSFTVTDSETGMSTQVAYPKVKKG